MTGRPSGGRGDGPNLSGGRPFPRRSTPIIDRARARTMDDGVEISRSKITYIGHFSQPTIDSYFRTFPFPFVEDLSGGLSGTGQTRDMIRVGHLAHFYAGRVLSAI